MSDATIKVALEADSAQFEKSLSKAAIMAEKFDRDLKKQTTGKTSGVGLPGLDLTPQSLRQLETASARAKELSRQTNQVGAAGQKGALGFLAFSQAVEDAQYGVKGVLNNIPQMYLGFGGSAGVAGVLSLAAVAAYAAYQAITKLSGLDAAISEAKALTDAESAFTEALKKNRQAREDRDAAAARGRKISEKNIDEGYRIDRATLIDDTAIRAAEQRMEAVKRARAAQDAIASSAAGIRPANETAAQQGAREWDQARVDTIREERRLREDVVAQQEYINKLASEYDRIRRATAETDRRLTGEAAALAAPMVEASQKASDMEAELARLKALQSSREKDTPLYRQSEQNINLLEERIRKEKELAKSLETERENIVRLIEKTQQQGQESLKALDSKKAASKESIALIGEEMRGLTAKAQMEASLIKFRAAQARGGELATKADAASAAAENVQGIVDEITLMDEALQKGGEKLRQLEKEKEIRRDMAELMKLGLNAIDAQTLAEDRQAKREAVQKAMAAQAGGTITERRQARSDQREEERQRRRDERVAEAAAKRAEARAKRQAEEERRFPKKDKDPGIKAQEQRDQIAKDAAKRAEEAAKARDENIKTQTEIQKSIKEHLEKIGAA